jgi:hypothetical protein
LSKLNPLLPPDNRVKHLILTNNWLKGGRRIQQPKADALIIELEEV